MISWRRRAEAEMGTLRGRIQEGASALRVIRHLTELAKLRAIFLIYISLRIGGADRDIANTISALKSDHKTSSSWKGLVCTDFSTKMISGSLQD